jgi:hypothetical protein
MSNALKSRVAKLEAIARARRKLVYFLLMTNQSGDDGLTSDEAFARRGQHPTSDDIRMVMDLRSAARRPDRRLDGERKR